MPTVEMMAGMDLAAVRLLLSGEGWGLLQSLPPYDAAAVLPLSERLRAAGFAPELVAAALTQAELRAAAADKFGSFAAEMLFTRDGLQQATRLPVAALHAARFVDAGLPRVLDLGCGIGSDSMAFAGVGLSVAAIDSDEVTAAVAGANLRHWADATVAVGRAEEVPLPGPGGARHTGAFLDPARRVSGVADRLGRTRRVSGLDAISPSWEFVRPVPGTGAKLAPSFPHAAVPAGAEAQWVSWAGAVVECGVWWGPLARVPGRSACLLSPGAAPVVVREADLGTGQPVVPRTVPARRPPSPRTVRDVSATAPWMYEPDRAVLQAGLVGALAVLVDGAELHPGVGYVSSDRVVDVPYARRYAVLEAMPLNVKALRSWLRDRRVGRVTVKQRGVRVDPAALRRELRLPGDGAEATLVLSRIGPAQVVLVVERR